MKNSKLRRVLMLMACAVLLVCLSVGATLAYLTAQTDPVTNTFSVGNVNFEKGINNGLDEAKTDLYGDPMKGEEILGQEDYLTADRTDKNEYKVLPAHTYVKDPTLHIGAGSEPCFVFIDINKITVSYTKTEGGVEVIEAAQSDDYNTIAKQMELLGWEPLTGYNTDGVGIYYNTTIVDTLNGIHDGDVQVFTKFMIADDAEMPTAEELDSMEITITAYAVQADGFQDQTVDKQADGSFKAVTATEAGAIAAWEAAFVTDEEAGA